MKSLIPDRNKNYGKHMIEIGILIMIANILTAIFIWQSILAGWKITEGGDLFYHAFLREKEVLSFDTVNQTKGYLFFLRLVFSFLGNHEELAVISNIILQFSGTIFFYLGSRKALGIKKSLLFFFFTAAISAGLFKVTEDSPVHFIWALLGVLFYFLSSCVASFYSRQRKSSKLIALLLGSLIGVFLYFDFSGIFLFILFLVFWKEEKKDFVLVFLSVSITFLFLTASVYTYSKSEVLFITRWFNDKYNFYLERTEALDQMIGIAILFLIYYMIHLFPLNKKRNLFTRVVPTDENITVQAASPITTVSSVLEVLSIEDKKNDEAEGKEDILLENAEEETLKEREIKFLENPLPLPKKHVKKEMNYAFEPSKEQMHYDLNNYDVKDDYDLK